MDYQVNGHVDKLRMPIPGTASLINRRHSEVWPYMPRVL